jgi:hypothetical protein
MVGVRFDATEVIPGVLESGHRPLVRLGLDLLQEFVADLRTQRLHLGRVQLVQHGLGQGLHLDLVFQHPSSPFLGRLPALPRAAQPEFRDGLPLARHPPLSPAPAPAHERHHGLSPHHEPPSE